MNKIGYLQYCKKILLVVAGGIIYSFGISLFLNPNGLAPGGLIGIAMILDRLLQTAGIHIGIGACYFALNIPIMVIGVWQLGIRMVAFSFAVVAYNSVLMDFIGQYGALTRDLLLSSIAGGVMVGTGLGLIFLAGTTSGGMDIIIKLIKKKRPHLKTGFLFMSIDLMVVVMIGILLGDINLAMYAGIAVFASARAMNYILYGSDEARLIYIISDQYEILAKTIMERLDTGVTILGGQGAYTGKTKVILMCVVRKQMMAGLEEVIRELDSTSFMIISSANEIYGEGYKNIMGVHL